MRNDANFRSTESLPSNPPSSVVVSSTTKSIGLTNSDARPLTPPEPRSQPPSLNPGSILATGGGGSKMSPSETKTKGSVMENVVVDAQGQDSHSKEEILLTRNADSLKLKVRESVTNGRNPHDSPPLFISKSHPPHSLTPPLAQHSSQEPGASVGKCCQRLKKGEEKILLMRSLQRSCDKMMTRCNTRAIEDIMCAAYTHLVSLFKDYLIYDDASEFLKRYYALGESRERLAKIFAYYAKYLKTSANYAILPERWIILRNLALKRKLREEYRKRPAEEARRKEVNKVEGEKLFTSRYLHELDEDDENMSVARAGHNVDSSPSATGTQIQYYLKSQATLSKIQLKAVEDGTPQPHNPCPPPSSVVPSVPKASPQSTPQEKPPEVSVPVPAAPQVDKSEPVLPTPQQDVQAEKVPVESVPEGPVVGLPATKADQLSAEPPRMLLKVQLPDPQTQLDGERPAQVPEKVVVPSWGSLPNSPSSSPCDVAAKNSLGNSMSNGSSRLPLSKFAKGSVNVIPPSLAMKTAESNMGPERDIDLTKGKCRIVESRLSIAPNKVVILKLPLAGMKREHSKSPEPESATQPAAKPKEGEDETKAESESDRLLKHTSRSKEFEARMEAHRAKGRLEPLQMPHHHATSQDVDALVPLSARLIPTDEISSGQPTCSPTRLTDLHPTNTDTRAQRNKQLIRYKSVDSSPVAQDNNDIEMLCFKYCPSVGPVANRPETAVEKTLNGNRYEHMVRPIQRRQTSSVEPYKRKEKPRPASRQVLLVRKQSADPDSLLRPMVDSAYPRSTRQPEGKSNVAPSKVSVHPSAMHFRSAALRGHTTQVALPSFELLKRNSKATARDPGRTDRESSHPASPNGSPLLRKEKCLPVARELQQGYLTLNSPWRTQQQSFVFPQRVATMSQPGNFGSHTPDMMLRSTVAAAMPHTNRPFKH